MNKAFVTKVLIDLNTKFANLEEDFENSFQEKYNEILNLLTCSHDDILRRLTSTSETSDSKDNFERKFIYLNFYLLELLNDELSKSDTEILSVQEVKNVKTALKTVALHGILKRLQPNLPHHVTKKSSEKIEAADILHNYTLLKFTVRGFCNCMKYPNLRMLIIPGLLQEILVAVYQIGFCPLKKPERATKTFFMTDEMYIKLMEDQELFKELLESLSQTIHPSIFIKETMILSQTDAPLWFKKAIASTLTKKMRSKKGVQYITLAMLGGSDNDSTKTWKVLDVLTKLILSSRTFSDFKENICQQVLSLLHLTKTEGLVFERLVVNCAKCLYYQDEDLCKEVFLDKITSPLRQFIDKEYKFGDDDMTDDLKQTLRLLYGCFVDSSVASPCLPINQLKHFLNVLFHFYHLTVKSSLHSTNRELKELLTKYLQKCTAVQTHQLLDNFLFGFTDTDIPQIRNDIIIKVDEKIVVESSAQSIIYTTAESIETVYDLLDTGQKNVLFGYFLKCLTNRDKYFSKTPHSTELLSHEDEAPGGDFERYLTVYKLLTQLSENKDVQTYLRDKPDDIIEYIDNVLCESSYSDLTFVVVMILDNLLSNTSAAHKYRVLLKSLETITETTTHIELRIFCKKVITKLTGDKSPPEAQKAKTNFDQALEDVRDPLLPTRGHGLLVLAKLVEKKDKQALERRQYLLNLFQLHLKEDDSFIYLNAVQGLASLADVFPDTVLEVLCEEYADFSKKDAEETRMKLGEALVRVVKLLGEMAPKYKSLLLNTFLSGTKDDDHLIRASSLSNLGEVCRVLNYKLGTIVTEVLVCVHAVITTDKAVEARRAAVTVMRQLFVGLKSEMITFLKDEILPIYRSLKEIYYNDKDDVMRLQAQLALEELNENVKTIVFPQPQLHLEKKIIMLD